MKNLTLTEAINITYNTLNSEYCNITVEITKSKGCRTGKPNWQIYDNKLGSSNTYATFEEALEELKIISNTPDRTKDVIVK